MREFQRISAGVVDIFSYYAGCENEKVRVGMW